jgi:hypothetical protein
MLKGAGAATGAATGALTLSLELLKKQFDLEKTVLTSFDTGTVWHLLP